MRILQIILILAFGTLPAKAQKELSATDQKAIEALSASWQDAWNRHDMKALANLVAENVDFITVGGRWLKSRDEFLKHHAERHEVVFKQSEWHNKDTHVKLIRPDLGVVHLEWAMKGDRDPDGTPRQARQGIFTWIVERKDKQWSIIEAQNTNINEVLLKK